MRSGGKAVARRASALLMSALLAFSTCPANAMAQEQDDVEAGPAVLLVDDANETTDEIGELAQELPPSDPAEDELPDQGVDDTENIAEPSSDDAAQQSENVEEGVQSESGDEQNVEELPVEDSSEESSEPALLESVRAQSTGTMIVDENPTGKSYYFDLSDETDKTTAYVKVYGVTSGDVSYDSTTATLQLNNASVSGDIESVGYLTLELVGSNTIRGYDSFYSESYYDSEAGEYVYYDDYTDGYDRDEKCLDVAGKLTVKGSGTLDLYYPGISCNGFVVSSGTIDGNVDTNGGNASVTGGTITGSVSTGKRDDDGDYVAWGSLTISDGTIGGTSCGTLTVSGKAKITYKHSGSGSSYTPINCTKIVMRGGVISITGDGDESPNPIECDSLTMTSGSITVSKWSEYYSHREISTKQLTMTGGSINVGIDAVYDSNDREVGGNVSIANGTIGGDISCGKFTLGKKAVIKGGVSGTNGIITNSSVGGGVSGANVTVTNSSVGGGAWCDILTVTGGSKITYKHSSDTSPYDAPIRCKSLIMRSGTVTVIGNKSESYSPISCDSMTMSGGTITISKWGSYSWYRAISAKQLTITGGSVSGEISGTTVTISGGSVNYKGTGANDSSTAVSCTTLTMRGGSIKVSKCGGVISCKTMTMAGGSIRADNCDGGIEAQEYADAKTANITIKKGTIVMNNPSGGCISSSHGNIAIKGGTITIKGSYGGGIYAGGTTYRGKRYGGKIKITGGKLTIITRKPSQSYAISADSITNKPSCLKKIVGRLSTGARFKVGGNTYQVSDYYSNYVNVYRYNSKKTEAIFKTVKYGKQKYNVSGVASNAFNTKQGAAVTSITFQNSIYSIGANAFKGTKSLRRLEFRGGLNGVYTTWSGSKQKLKVDKQYFKYNKKAFSGAGAKGGSGLTVTMRDSADEAHLYRPFLLKKGLPKGATVTASQFNN